MTSPSGKPRLLIVELWNLGDLVIATPFLRAAAEKYDVTILTKPYPKDLQSRMWPEVKMLPFTAPWTAFRRKYWLHTWPWVEIFRFSRDIRAAKFAVGLSARWDPRDHFLLMLSAAKRRLGFPRLGSRIFLTEPLNRPDPAAHRYENWRIIGQALGIDLPSHNHLSVPSRRPGELDQILVHTGAGQPVRVWPLDRYRQLVSHLRAHGYNVYVVCDPNQRDWWLRSGETAVSTPQTVLELLALLDKAAAFVGNDSGPGHLAAFSGVPTFTIFGPQLPEWFAPLHPLAEWVEGKACPYKPCSDYCRFASPLCIERISAEEICARVETFAAKHVPLCRPSAAIT